MLDELVETIFFCNGMKFNDKECNFINLGMKRFQFFYQFDNVIFKIALYAKYLSLIKHADFFVILRDIKYWGHRVRSEENLDSTG